VDKRILFSFCADAYIWLNDILLSLHGQNPPASLSKTGFFKFEFEVEQPDGYND
jgi:hypothetical protein